MLVHVGNSVAGSMSPDRIEALSGRFMAAFSARMMAGLDKKMASIAAKKPAATRQKAKPVSRAARLRQAEASVKAMQPRDARCCWSDMRTA